MSAEAEIVKIRLRFDEGSQTLNQCDPQAEDKDLFEVAEAVASLRDYDKVEYIKVSEARLFG